MSAERDLISTATAAQIAGVTPSTLRSLAARASTKCPPPKPIRIDARSTVWVRSEVEAWAESRDRKRGRAARAPEADPES
jgi:predicted DNA-binding transcriptional regulator AlpA